MRFLTLKRAARRRAIKTALCLECLNSAGPVLWCWLSALMAVVLYRSHSQPEKWLRKALTILVQLQFFGLLGVVVRADGPVLFPAIQQVQEFVEYTDTRELIPIQGSYSWYLCQSSISALEERNDCPDVMSVVIHTRRQTFELNIANLTDEGVPVPFEQEPQLEEDGVYPPACSDLCILHCVAVQFEGSGPLEEETITAILGRSGSIRTLRLEGLRSDGVINFNVSTPNWSQTVVIDRDTVPPQIIRNDCDFPHFTNDEQEESVIHFQIVFSEMVYIGQENEPCSSDLRPLGNMYTAVDLLEASLTCRVDLTAVDFASVIRWEGNISNENVTSRNISIDGISVVEVDVTLTLRMDTDINLIVPPRSLMDKAGNLLNEGINISTATCRPDLSPGDSQELVDSISRPERTNELPTWRPFPTRPIGELCAIMTTSSIVMSLTASMISSSLGSNTNPGAMKLLGYSQKLYMTGRLAAVNMPSTYRNFTEQFDWAMFDNGGTTVVGLQVSSHREGSGSERRLLQFEGGPEIVYRNRNISASEEYFNRVVFWVPLTFAIVLFGHAIALLIFLAWKRDIPAFFAAPRLEIMFGYFCVPAIVMSSTGLYDGDRSNQHAMHDNPQNGHPVGDALLATWMLIAFPTSFLCWNVSVMWNNFVTLPLAERKVHMFIELGEYIPHDSSYFRRAYTFLTGLQRRQEAAVQQPAVPQGAPQEIEMAALGPGPAGTSIPPTDPLSLVGMGDWEDEEETETTTTTSYTRPHTVSPTTSVVSSSLQGFANCCQCISGFFTVPFLNAMLGRRRTRAQWTGIRAEGTAFLSKYGYLFEDHRGPPVIREEATYLYDLGAGVVNRGVLVLADDICSVKLPCIGKYRCQLYPFHIHLSMKILELIKLVVLACLAGTVGKDRDSTAEMICLFTLSLILLVTIRMSKPFLDRFDMAVALLVELADFLIYVSLYVIVTRNDHNRNNFAEKVGVFMLVAQCTALGFLVVRYAFATMYVTITCVAYHHQRSASKFSKALDRVLWTYMPHYLEHKYFDRWMVKALHKGLYNRRPSSSELPRSVVMRELARTIYRSVISIFLLGRTEDR